jgi:hypothetical protein
MPKTSKLAATHLQAQAKVLQAVKLRKQGLDWDSIAKAVGYKHRSTIWRHVEAWYEKRQTEIGENIDRLRDLDLDRLDTMLYALRGRIQRGEPRAIDTGLRILERRAKLLGLDAALKQQITGADGGPLAIEDARAALAARIAAIAPEPESDPAPTGAGEPT